jgi:hypothetical protein
MLAEMTDNDPKAYAWLSVGANIASTIMPAITGALYETGRAGGHAAAMPCTLAGLLVAVVAAMVYVQVCEVGSRNMGQSIS